MRKALIAATLLLSVSLTLPASASSLTEPQIQALEGLLSSFNVPQATITTVDHILRGVPTTVTATGGTTGGGGGYTFTKPLTVGSTGTDVSELQKLLKAQGYFSYPSITTYYGPATAAAVAAFQKAHHIDAIGGVGPLTRTILNQLESEEGSTASNTATPPTGTAASTTPSFGTTGGGGGGGNAPTPSVIQNYTPPAASGGGGSASGGSSSGSSSSVSGSSSSGATSGGGSSSSSTSVTMGAASTSCPKGSTYQDGCASAPSGTAQHPSLLSSYAVRPPWNVAGVDYAVGITPGTVLKDPATAALPSGVSRDLTFHIFNVSGNNVTLDGWDFSLENGWMILPGNGVSGLTISNSNFKLGSNRNPFIWPQGNITNGMTVKNNVFDGNSIPISITTSASSASGTNVLRVTNTTGIVVGMAVGDSSTANAIPTSNNAGGSETRVQSIVPNTSITLTLNTIGVVNTGDTITFQWTAQYDVPIIAGVTDAGTTAVQYNWFKNAEGEDWQQSPASTGGQLNMSYNLFENTSYGQKTLGSHGDVVQEFGSSGNFAGLNFGFNTVLQNTNAAAALGLNIVASGLFGATIGPVTEQYNALVYSATPAQNAYGLTAINPTWAQAVTINGNYADTTGMLYGWFCAIGGCGGGTGPYSTIPTVTGNIDMNTGAILPSNGNLPSVQVPATPPSDTTPPTMIIATPTGQLAAGTTQATLGVTTNEAATCAYATATGVAFASMTQFTTTGALSHTTTLGGLSNGSSYVYYIKCKDTAGNISADSSASFSIASPVAVTPPPTTSGTAKTIFLTSGTTWTVPSDWNSSNNMIGVIGGGGSGGSDTANGGIGSGGGGGGYSKVTNVSLTQGASIAIALGSGGPQSTGGAAGTAGGDTYFNGASCGTASVCAKGGGAGGAGSISGGFVNGGIGGAASSGTGSTKFSGGNGGITGGGGGGGGSGGGGSAGPNGNGGNGGAGTVSSWTGTGAGGGGSGGGTSGQASTETSGGAANGGNNSSGIGGGAGGLENGTLAGSGNNAGAGTNGGGGGGGGNGYFGHDNEGDGGAGGAGTEWDVSHGSGGGGGGSGSNNVANPTKGSGGAGGLYGAGGAGGGVTGGNGAQGIIVITYTP